MLIATHKAGFVRVGLRRLWRRTAGAGGRFAVDLLFPPRCARCDADLPELTASRHDVLLCEECRRVLAPGPWSGCRRCGAKAPAELPSPPTCTWCEAMRLGMDRSVVLGAYEGKLREAVLRLKRSSEEPLAVALARLFWRSRQKALRRLDVDLVVPVPMHWTRRLVRGVNNPDVLAAEVASKLKVPAADRTVYRCRKTLPQANLTRNKRFRNVRGAFRLGAGYDLRGARVLLVDDILTTGATSSEIAKLLKEAGVSMVAVGVLARAAGARPLG